MSGSQNRAALRSQGQKRWGFATVPRINRGLVNVGACLIAGIRLARESYRDRIEDAPMAVACPTRPSDLGILGDISGTMTIYIMPNGHYISL
jgi:hypothetical protein